MKNQRKIGVILSYLSQGVHILTGLIYTPVMLRLLGQSEYGLYQLVASVVSYLSLLSFGFSASYVRFYSRYNEKGESEKIEQLNGMFLSIFLLIALLCIVCGVVMVLNITRIFGSGLTEAEYVKARILMFILVINLSLTFPISVFDCITSAHERFFFQKLVTFLQNLLNPFLCLPLLILGFGSIGMVMVTTGLTVCRLLLNMYYVLKKMKIRFSFGGFDFTLFKEMFVFTFFIFINQIIDQVNWSVDKFLLGRLSGTTAVAIYGVGATINTMYLQFSTSIAHVFIPKVNRIIAHNEKSRQVTELFVKVGRVQYLLLGLIITGFIFFGKPFMELWAGKSYDQAYYVALLLILPVTVPLIQNIGIEIQRAMNKHQVRSIVYLLIAIGNIFMSIPLIHQMGAAGAALGTAISLTLGNILFMNWFYHRHLYIDILYFWKNIGQITLSFLLPILCGLLLNHYLDVYQPKFFVLGIMIYTLCYCGSIWRFGMNEQEKDIFYSVIRKLGINHGK